MQTIHGRTKIDMRRSVQQSGTAAGGDLLVRLLCGRDRRPERRVQHVLEDVSCVDNRVYICRHGRCNGHHSIHSAHLRRHVPFMSDGQKGV
jgi:hypothetical protein